MHYPKIRRVRADGWRDRVSVRLLPGQCATAYAARAEELANSFSPPKSAAGVRNVALPVVLVDELHRHIERYAGPGPEGLVFRGEKGAMLRRGTSAAAPDGRKSWSRRGCRLDSTSTICDTPATSPRPMSARQRGN